MYGTTKHFIELMKPSSTWNKIWILLDSKFYKTKYDVLICKNVDKK